MNKAVFLDRDGVINDGTSYYTYKIEDFRFNPGVFEGLLLLKQAGFLLVVITNQSGVAKGVYSETDVNKVHEYMCKTLLEKGIMIDAVFYCPHHPDISSCECRKPGTLLIENAIKEFIIDRQKSYLIGDSKRDVQAAEKAGVKPIHIMKNENIEAWCLKISSGKI